MEIIRQTNLGICRINMKKHLDQVGLIISNFSLQLSLQYGNKLFMNLEEIKMEMI